MRKTTSKIKWFAAISVLAIAIPMTSMVFAAPLQETQAVPEQVSSKVTETAAPSNSTQETTNRTAIPVNHPRPCLNDDYHHNHQNHQNRTGIHCGYHGKINMEHNQYGRGGHH